MRSGKLIGVAAVAAMLVTSRAMALDLSEWPSIQMPPPPELKPATVDPKTSALFLFDFMTENCGARPRCVEIVPKLKALQEKARAANMPVFFTLPGNGKPIDPALTPRAGELVDQKQGGPDKFLNDDLDQSLRAKGIKTVIVCGTSGQGVGLGTGAAAVQRGFEVVYPIDCNPSESAFREAYTAWHMGGGGPPVTTRHVTLTRSDMIKFGG